MLGKLENCTYKIDNAKTGYTDISLALSNLLEKDLNMHLKVMEDKKGMNALERLLTVLKLEQDSTNSKKF